MALTLCRKPPEIVLLAIKALGTYLRKLIGLNP